MRKADLDRLVAGARYGGSTVTAERLVGLEACLGQLEGQIALFARPELAVRFGLEPSGTLFVGPPGTGKTLTARYLAGRLDRPLYQVSADQFGADPDLVHGLFTRLSAERAILFIDEVSILAQRRAWSNPEDRRMLSSLLTSLDGLATIRGPERLWVIGACTDDIALDPALHRSGRLGVVIEFAEPSEAQRRELFALYLAPVPNHIGSRDIDRLALMANGATGADIADWVSQSASQAVADAPDTDPVIELAQLEAIVNRRGFVAAKGRPDREPRWDTAVHEAGHAVVAHDLFGAAAMAKVEIGWGQFDQVSEGKSIEAAEGRVGPVATRRSPAEEAAWKVRGWAADELGSIYAENGGRYVVSLIVTYNDSPPADVAAGREDIPSPEGVAAAALALTRDAGSRGTIWHVFDRLTGQMHPLAQRDFEQT